MSPTATRTTCRRTLTLARFYLKPTTCVSLKNAGGCAKLPTCCMNTTSCVGRLHHWGLSLHPISVKIGSLKIRRQWNYKGAMTTNRLSRKTKLAYGAGDLGAAIVTAINGFFLLNFLINVAGLRPGTAGNVFLIAKIWDAVNDPLIGWLTDRTVSKFGRRRPWLLIAAVPFGLAFFLQWIVPPLGETGLFWYYLLVAILLDTAFTAVNVPYAALTAELTQDYDERTRLSSVRMGFSILGGVLAAFFHGIIVSQFPQDPKLGYMISAAIWAFAIAGPCFITFFGTKEPDFAVNAKPTGEAPGFVEGFRIAFNNKPFILVTLIYMLSWLAIQF